MEFTKQNLKDVFLDSLEPFARSIQIDLNEIKERLTSLEGDSVEIKGRLVAVETDVKWMRNNSGELFTKLDHFIALQEENKQEITILNVHVRDLEKRISLLEEQKV